MFKMGINRLCCLELLIIRFWTTVLSLNNMSLIVVSGQQCEHIIELTLGRVVEL